VFTSGILTFRAVFHWGSRGSSKVSLGFTIHSMPCGQPTPGRPNGCFGVGCPQGKCAISFWGCPLDPPRNPDMLTIQLKPCNENYFPEKSFFSKNIFPQKVFSSTALYNCLCKCRSCAVQLGLIALSIQAPFHLQMEAKSQEQRLHHKWTWWNQKTNAKSWRKLRQKLTEVRWIPRSGEQC
jgi:hypothetical protein